MLLNSRSCLQLLRDGVTIDKVFVSAKSGYAILNKKRREVSCCYNWWVQKGPGRGRRQSSSVPTRSWCCTKWPRTSGTKPGPRESDLGLLWSRAQTRKHPQGKLVTWKSTVHWVNNEMWGSLVSRQCMQHVKGALILCSVNFFKWKPSVARISNFGEKS